MYIVLTPQRRDDELTVVKAGDVLTINGESFDFSELPDGATIPDGVIPCEWIIGAVERQGGELRLTIILPHGPNPSQAVAFPEALVGVQDGEVPLPFDPLPADIEEVEHVEG